MNNKGYITSSVLILIILFSVLYLVIFYGKMTKTNNDVIMSSSINKETVVNSNSKERLYSLLRENISYRGNVAYDDLKTNYEIETTKEEFESVHLQSQNNSINFTINNRTDINVELIATPIDDQEGYSYSAELNYNGTDLLGESAKNIQSNFTKTIDKDVIYNLETSKTKYGSYSLNLSNLNNVSIVAKIHYDKMNFRELIITSDNFEMEVVIENKDNKPTIKSKS